MTDEIDREGNVVIGKDLFTDAVDGLKLYVSERNSTPVNKLAECKVCDGFFGEREATLSSAVNQPARAPGPVDCTAIPNLKKLYYQARKQKSAKTKTLRQTAVEQLVCVILR